MFFEGFRLTTEADLGKVYAEMKRVRVELQTIEKTLEALVDSMLPTGKLSPEEKAELRQIEEEMNRGECISLEESKRKLVEKPAKLSAKKAAKKHAQVPPRDV